MMKLRPFWFLVALVGCDAAVDTTDDTDDTDDTNETDETDETDDTTETDETDDTVVSNCTITPGAWAAPNWETSAAEALALRATLDAFSAVAMREAEQGTRAVDEVSDLTPLLATGTPSINAVITPAFSAVVDDVLPVFVDVIVAGAQDLVDDGDGSFVGGDAGGIFGTSLRGIHAGGVEVRQILDKGLFGGGALYPWALSLTEGTITADTIDAIAAAWGADATLTAEGTLTDSASYANGVGLFASVADPLIAAKAYAGDPDCEVERDEALVEAFRAWELGLVARYVYYANGAATRMANATSENDVAEAIHGVSEGQGLAAGLIGVPDPADGPLAGNAVLASDVQLAGFLDDLGLALDDLEAATTGDLCADPTALAAATTALEGHVKAAYGLTDEQIASYRPVPN